MAEGRGSGSSRDGIRHFVKSKDPKSFGVCGHIEESTDEWTIVRDKDGRRWRVTDVAEVREVPWI